MEDRPVSAHGEHIAPTAAPDAHEHLHRPARLRGPRRPVEMVNRAVIGYGEDVAPTGAPDSLEVGGRRPTRLWGPARPVVVQDRSARSCGENVAATGAPDATDLERRPAWLRRPARPIIVKDGAVMPHGKHIASRAAPNANESLRRAARLRQPTLAIVMEDRAGIPHGEHVAPTRAPDGNEEPRRPAQLRCPTGAVVVEDLPPVPHYEHVARRRSPYFPVRTPIPRGIVQPAQHGVLLRRTGIHQHLKGERDHRARHRPLPRLGGRDLRRRQGLVVEEIRLVRPGERTRAVGVRDGHRARPPGHRGPGVEEHLHPAHGAPVGRAERLRREVLHRDVGLERAGSVVTHIARAQRDVRALPAEDEVSGDPASALRAGNWGRGAAQGPSPHIGRAAQHTTCQDGSHHRPSDLPVAASSEDKQRDDREERASHG